MTNNIRPINTPDDLKGMKMRSPNDISFIETFKALGSSVSTMTYTQIYTGLSQGAIQGQFNPLANIFELNIDDVQDHLAMTNHAFYVAYIIMNKEVFDCLDYEHKKILLEAGSEGKDAARKYVKTKEKELEERAKKAFKNITYPELRPFKELVQPMYTRMEKVMGAEIINSIQDLLKKYRSKN
jgi:C4-dicarboxylate-binding protein DctP